MDLKPDFDQLLKQRNAPPTRGAVSLETIDSFLEEALRINSHITNLHRTLRNARRAYLSRAQPRKRHADAQSSIMSDEDREALDINAKEIMRDANWSIESLEGAEKLRFETQKKAIQKKFGSGIGALSSWASGGIVGSKTPEYKAAESEAEELRTHRDGVLWYLRQQLQLCGKTQSGMMEKRLKRELEQSRSLGSQGMSFADFAEFTGTTANTGDDDAGQKGAPAQDLTAEQLQMFEEDNQDMMTHFESMHEKVRTAQRSLAEISELQSTLISHLSTQADNIELLVEESQDTTEKVQEGNKQLKKATERPSMARMTFYAASGLCAFLITWDLII